MSDSVEDFVSSMRVSDELKGTIKKNLSALASHDVEVKKRSGLFDENGNLKVPEVPVKKEPEVAPDVPKLPFWLECPKCHRTWLHTHGKNFKVRCKECGGTIRIPGNIVNAPEALKRADPAYQIRAVSDITHGPVEKETEYDVVPLLKDSMAYQEMSRKIRHSFEVDAPKVRDLLEQGKTGIQICGELGISSGTLYVWKKKLGLLQYHLKRKDEPKEKAKEEAPELPQGAKEKPLDFYLDLAQDLLAEIKDKDGSFLTFVANEQQRDDYDPMDIFRALEILVRFQKIKVEVA